MIILVVTENALIKQPFMIILKKPICSKSIILTGYSCFIPELSQLYICLWA